MPHFIFTQQISVLNILNILYNLHFFSSKCRLFHNATLFGFCIIHILNTGVLKFKKKTVAKRLTQMGEVGVNNGDGDDNRMNAEKVWEGNTEEMEGTDKCYINYSIYVYFTEPSTPTTLC